MTPEFHIKIKEIIYTKQYDSLLKRTEWVVSYKDVCIGTFKSKTIAEKMAPKRIKHLMKFSSERIKNLLNKK